jgi:hypothetical protein
MNKLIRWEFGNIEYVSNWRKVMVNEAMSRVILLSIYNIILCYSSRDYAYSFNFFAWIISCLRQLWLSRFRDELKFNMSVRERE